MAGKARRAALQALLQVERDKGFSNVVLENLLRTAQLSPADQALASRLVYGVVERRLTLDYLLGACSSVPLKKVHPTVLEILRIGCYQLLYMERIPPSAAVSESVNLARAMKQDRAAGFVNGVLRSVERKKAALLAALPDTPEGWEVRYSCPQAWIRLWMDAYGADTARNLLEHINDVAPSVLRVNTLRTTPQAFCEALEQAEIPYACHEELPACVTVGEASRLKGLAQDAKNWYYHQDTASQWCCRALEARPGDRVADVCAAPGGKSLTVAQYMENRGEILACDLYPAKCDGMEKRAADMGASCIRTAVRDAAMPPPAALEGRFDRVICDVPCSGLGVIRRKPEIRYKSPEEFRELPALQARILEQAARLVRPGGVLQYSTCTLSPAENEQVAERFLASHPEFAPRTLPLSGCFAAAGLEPGYAITLLPHLHGTDGFFMAAFTRRQTG